MALLAAAFARRGAGSCAESPPRDSLDFVGVVESYEVEPPIVLGAPTLDDSPASCDDDGVLDAGEGGTLTVKVTNASPAADDGRGGLGSTTAGVTFPAGATVELGTLPPFGSGTVDHPGGARCRRRRSSRSSISR